MMFETTTPRSISMLTSNDSKVLGNMKSKLKKLHDSNNFQTNKFKTLNSTWTPLNDKTANNNIFEERVDLVSHWFDLWNDKQRKWFLLNILSKCRPSQICYLEEAFDHFGVYERKDFTTVLPKHLTLHIFSFLSAKDLSRCAQVSSHWKFLSEQDEIWQAKCLRFGWYLPYKPLKRELGAWKAHYIDCVTNINATPMTKENAFTFRDQLYRRELTDKEKEKFLYSTSKRKLSSWESHEIQIARKPWMPSSQRPKDLHNSQKLLYSTRANTNEPIEDNFLNSSYKTKFGLPIQSAKPSLKKLKRSKSIHGDMLNELKKSIPLHLFEIKEKYNKMRKSESDLFATKLSESSLNAYNNYKTTTFLNSNFFNTSSASLLKQNDIAYSNIIFISSKVPCCHMLLESLSFKNVISIPYDFETTHINTLIRLLENSLNESKAKSIAFFLHFEKPGQLPITKETSAYKVNIENCDLSNFFLKVTSHLVSDGKLDFFVPLGSSVDGLELVEKLHKITCVDIRVPTGYLGNYKFVNSKWLNSGDNFSNPSSEYFVEIKLNLWVKYCEILQEAHDKVSDLILNGYVGDFNEKAIKKTIGSVIFESLSKSSFLYDSKIQNELKSIISKAASSPNFFVALSNELKQSVSPLQSSSTKSLSEQDNVIKQPSVTLIEAAEKGSNEYINQTPHSSSETKPENSLKPQLSTSSSSAINISDTMLRSDVSLKTFLKHKSQPELVEPSIRTQIILELVRSEINYMKCLEIIQKYFARPLKNSRDAGHVIISQSVIDLLFNELAVLYNVSKEMVKDFNMRIKSWTLLTCIGEIINKYVENFQYVINYANNYDTILSTLDKLLISNPRFRAFFLPVNSTILTNMMTIQELMEAPWSRLKEYMNLLGSLLLHTSKDHPDYLNISKCLNKIREMYLFVKQVQERVENKYRMLDIQKSILNAPDFLTIGRYFIIEEKAILLNRTTFKYVKDITCFLFNDSLLLAYRAKKHFPFVKFSQETLIFYDFIGNLKEVTIDDSINSIHAHNAIELSLPNYKEFIIDFESYDKKFNFLNSLRSIKQLIA